MLRATVLNKLEVLDGVEYVVPRRSTSSFLDGASEHGRDERGANVLYGVFAALYVLVSSV